MCTICRTAVDTVLISMDITSASERDGEKSTGELEPTDRQSGIGELNLKQQKESGS